MKILNEFTITDVTGFKAVGLACGLKKSGKKDLCVIYSENKAISAGAFTTNKVKAAPVLLNMSHIENQNTQAIVINSANANACTGEQGYKDAYTMAKTTADCLGLKPEEVLVASTGVIGVPLPMDIIESGIKNACSSLSNKGGKDAAEAIMTTDTFPKKVTIQTNIGGHDVLISGIAKGSGMIHPNMATMLGFITTDTDITKEMLSKALKNSIEDSFNMISVDGDTSTNDMVIILANGTAGNKKIIEEDSDYSAFKEALDFVTKELAKLIAQDGEGATKLIEVNLKNAVTSSDAKLCAKSVISSSLVKSAFFGSDANWGRILCAIGYSGGEFSPDKVDLFFKSEAGTIQLVSNGSPLEFDETLAKKILDQKHIYVIIDLKDGHYNATAWGCDLTYDYVKINGSYRT